MPAVDPRLLVGPETYDDAAVVALSAETALCFTADFITPVVDDPRAWGQVAAANAISDVYAMGGQPLAALNLVAWPSCLPPAILAEVLAGGAQKAAEAGCMVVGGHTVADKEPKYGMAVIGTVHPDRILRNQGALPGDLLYLTKPLGTGIITTAIKADLAGPEETAAVLRWMTALNRDAAQAARAAGVRALTDVTGFGLLGHLTEMLGAEGTLGAQVSAAALPLLPNVRGLMDQGMMPAGAYNNREAFQPRVRIAPAVHAWMEMLFYDPQTSGGLLAAIAPENAARLEEEAAKRGVSLWRIGACTASGRIEVVP